MTNSSDKRPVLIVGATSDVSVSLARLMAEAGHPIHLAGRRVEALESIAQDLRVRSSVPVATHTLDVADYESIDPTLQALEPKPGIIVSMVGDMGDQSVSQSNTVAANHVFAVNLNGPVALMEAGARLFEGLEEPTALVGVSSVAGDRGRARNYVYGAAKAGFTAALSGLRQRLQASSTTVITIKPGFVDTKATADLELPDFLTESSDSCAARIYRAIQKRREVVYPWKWRLVMTIIRAIPEPIFKRLSF